MHMGVPGPWGLIIVEDRLTCLFVASQRLRKSTSVEEYKLPRSLHTMSRTRSGTWQKTQFVGYWCRLIICSVIIQVQVSVDKLIRIMQNNVIKGLNTYVSHRTPFPHIWTIGFWNEVFQKFTENHLLYYLFIEVIFEGSSFELEKSIFEVKHTCTFWTTKYI